MRLDTGNYDISQNEKKSKTVYGGWWRRGGGNIYVYKGTVVAVIDYGGGANRPITIIIITDGKHSYDETF